MCVAVSKNRTEKCTSFISTKSKEQKTLDIKSGRQMKMQINENE